MEDVVSFGWRGVARVKATHSSRRPLPFLLPLHDPSLLSSMLFPALLAAPAFSFVALLTAAGLLLPLRSPRLQAFAQCCDVVLVHDEYLPQPLLVPRRLHAATPSKSAFTISIGVTVIFTFILLLLCPLTDFRKAESVGRGAGGGGSDSSKEATVASRVVITASSFAWPQHQHKMTGISSGYRAANASIIVPP